MTVLTVIGIIIAAALIAAGVIYLALKNNKSMGIILLAAALVVIVGVAVLNNAKSSENTEADQTGDVIAAVTVTPMSATVTPGNTSAPTEDVTPTAAPDVTAAPTEAPTEAPTPTPTPTPEPTATPDPNWNGSTIYLTFDDGPSENVTPLILDTLKEYGIHATFFILDFEESEIPILQRMVDEGHTIGIHGYSHDYAVIYANDQAYIDSVNTLSDKIYAAVGVRPEVLRFPGGSSNTTSKQYCAGIMTRLTQYVLEHGYQYFDWNVSPEDAMSRMTSEEISDAVIKGLSTGRTENVVLMHDASAQITSGQAVKAIIEYGLANGYHFDKLTKDTPPVHHTIFN